MLSFLESINKSIFLKNEKYIVLYEPLDINAINKIQINNKTIELFSENIITYGVCGCSVDIEIGHSFEVLLNIEDVSDYILIDSTLRYVYALGYKQIEQVPSDWNVAATIEFAQAIPKEFNLYEGKKYCLTSKKMLEQVQDIRS